MAASIASSLNLLLGTPFPENPDADIVEKISVSPHTYKALTPHNGINSDSYNTKGERVEREEERTYCIVFLFYTLAYN